MIIKISEKPVISLKTGKTLGTLQGLISQNNKVTFLYCGFLDRQVYIPIADAHIGRDAIMLEDFEDHLLPTNESTKVYTNSGEEVGVVTSVEMDDSFNITGVMVDHQMIEIDKILHMGNIIIVDLQQENIELVSSGELVEESSEDLGAVEELIETPLENIEMLEKVDGPSSISTETMIEDGPHPIDDSMTLEESSDLPSEELEDEIATKDNLDVDKDVSALEEIKNASNPKEDVAATIEIDVRYHHLLGKRLLGDIIIAKETHEKGTLIDAHLVQSAITNNSIVKLIMNTED